MGMLGWGHCDRDGDIGMKMLGWGPQGGGQGFQDGDGDPRMGILVLGHTDLLMPSIKGPRAALSHHVDLGTPARG